MRFGRRGIQSVGRGVGGLLEGSEGAFRYFGFAQDVFSVFF